MKSYIAVVVDRSGSMSDPTVWGGPKMCDVAMEGIRSFVKEQKAMKINGKTGFSLVEFDGGGTDVVEQVNDIKSSVVEYTLKPRGNTPLWDSIGFTVDHINEKIAKLRTRDKPKGVMVVVVTDGLENASTKWNKATITRLIETKKKEGWDFTFLCNNPMVAKDAENAGLQNVALYDNRNLKAAYSAVSSKVGRVRNSIEQTGTYTSNTASFTENELSSMK